MFSGCNKFRQTLLPSIDERIVKPTVDEISRCGLSLYYFGDDIVEGFLCRFMIRKHEDIVRKSRINKCGHSGFQSWFVDDELEIVF